MASRARPSHFEQEGNVPIVWRAIREKTICIFNEGDDGTLGGGADLRSVEQRP